MGRKGEQAGRSPAERCQGFLVRCLLAFTLLLILYTSVSGQDELVVTPDEPEWGDTLRIELRPAKERGRLYLYYEIDYPFGESRSGWAQLRNEDGIYTAPPIRVDSNSIRMRMEVKGQHYLETICPFLPFKEMNICAAGGRPADRALGDTSEAMLSSWRRLAREDAEKARAYIEKLNGSKSQPLPHCYVIAQAYLSLGEDEKALAFVRKMHEMDPSSPLILHAVGDIFHGSPEVMDEVERHVVRFLERNPGKPISWNTLSRRLDSTPDSVARRVLDAWHSAEPKDPRPLYYLAILSQRANRLDQALRFIDQAIGLQEQDFLLIYSEHRSEVPTFQLKFRKLRGDLKHQRGELAAAIRDYERAAAVPVQTYRLVPIYLKLASLYGQSARTQESQLCWFKAYIAGDTTDSESMLRGIHSKERSGEGSFRQYLRQLHEKVKLEYPNGPDFETTDSDGQRVRLSDNQGKLTMLYFWSPGCPPCVHMIPCLNQIRDDFVGRGVEFWAIGSSDERYPIPRPFEFRTIPAYVDLWQKYNITGTPQSFVIGPDGRILYHMIGGSRSEQDTSVCDTLRRILERLTFILG